MKKVLLVATVQSHICQFHKPLVKMLHDHGCEVHVAARDNLAQKNGLKLDFVEKVFSVPFERSPFHPRNLKAYRELKRIIDSENYDVIHTNTPVGGIVGRLASVKSRKQGCKVLYTAHGFHFFQGGSKKNWIIYYPIERFMSRLTDVLITITEEDYLLAKEKFHCKVERIHGIGANSAKYFPVDALQRQLLRQELGLYPNEKLLLCTGELNANKNQSTAIHAMAQVIRKEPHAKLFLAGIGPAQNSLETLIGELDLNDHVKLLGYRTDLERFVNAADLVISCSYREGLPVNIIEAMLCKKAVVASVNRGHKELVNPENGFLVRASDADDFAQKILHLLEHEENSHAMGESGYKIAQLYTDTAVYVELQSIYSQILGGE